MRCLVTGATGFVGSHLVRLLLEHDCQIAILVRSTSNLWRLRDVIQRVEIILGDLVEITQVAPLIQQFAPETVFHLGWLGVSGEQRNNSNQIQNLAGSLKLLQIVSESGCKCWIGLGSQAEYGWYNGILTEDSPTHPETMYGVTKLCVGLLGQKLCKTANIRFAWLRLFAVYGPMDDPDYLIPYTICKLLQGDTPLLTLGEQRWDYLFVQDAAYAVLKVALTPSAHGIFNLASGKANQVRQIVERIRDLINPDLPLGFGEKPYSVNQVMLLQANIQRLKDATGWRPCVSFDEGLYRTIEWYRTQMVE
jgi:UDP-glucose 4-epimerase